MYIWVLDELLELFSRGQMTGNQDRKLMLPLCPE